MAGRSNSVASSLDFLAALSPTEVKNSLNSFAMTEQSRVYGKLSRPLEFKQPRTVFHIDDLFSLFDKISFRTKTISVSLMVALTLRRKILYSSQSL